MRRTYRHRLVVPGVALELLLLVERVVDDALDGMQEALVAGLVYLAPAQLVVLGRLVLILLLHLAAGTANALFHVAHNRTDRVFWLS